MDDLAVAVRPGRDYAPLVDAVKVGTIAAQVRV
jgi:hypothetical protein